MTNEWTRRKWMKMSRLCIRDWPIPQGLGGRSTHDSDQCFYRIIRALCPYRGIIHFWEKGAEIDLNTTADAVEARVDGMKGGARWKEGHASWIGDAVNEGMGASKV